MLKIDKSLEGTKAVYTLEGRLDTLTAPELEKELQAGLDGVTELTLDLEKLAYISSAGLRILLATHKQMARQGALKLVHVQSTVMEIFEVTGFADILTIE